MKEYLDMWKNYANFSGRTSVRGYWMAFLFNMIASFALSLIASILPALAILGSLYTLAALIPGIAITTDHIIVCDGGRYNITSVEDVKGRGMYIEVLAKKVEATNG